MIPPDEWVPALGVLPIEAELPQPHVATYDTDDELGELRPLPVDGLVVRAIGTSARYELGRSGALRVSLVQPSVFAALLVDRIEPPPRWDPCGNAGGSFEPCAPAAGSWSACDG